jgi:hypothetical protein
VALLHSDNHHLGRLELYFGTPLCGDLVRVVRHMALLRRALDDVAADGIREGEVKLRWMQERLPSDDPMAEKSLEPIRDTWEEHFRWSLEQMWGCPTDPDRVCMPRRGDTILGQHE